LVDPGPVQRPPGSRERNDAKRGGEIDRALACVSAESLAPDAEGNIWWHGVLDDDEAL
jgi:hypothetical protein